MTNASFAKVAVAAGKTGNKTFDYAITPEIAGKIAIGCRVVVPFGKSRNAEGFVVELSDHSDFDPARIKPITDILDDFPIFSPVFLRLAMWMSEKYSTPLAVCLRMIMPAGIGLRNDYVAEITASRDGQHPPLRGKQKQIWEYLTEHGGVSQRELLENFGQSGQTALKALVDKEMLTMRHIYEVKDFTLRINTVFLVDDAPNFDDLRDKVMEKGGAQAKVLSLLMENHSMAMSDIQHFLHISPSPVKTLETKGLVRIERVEVRRNVVSAPIAQKEFELTEEQAAAMKCLGNTAKPVLIQGVTGSGKTELYIRTIQRVLEAGKQAIVLVPEISLTPQTITAFAARFGDAVTATHSRLSLGERFDQWKKARDGQISVIIGPRSALFTPFANLGVIILDEEHESTYKSDQSPKYDTLAVAEELARLTGALLICGSATPNISTYHRAVNGDFELVTMHNRVNKLPIIAEVADMRTELALGNKSIFSAALYTSLKQTLAAGKQAILFINRRGHSTFVACRSCGHVMSCSNCSVNYTYHIYSGKLACHYCAATVQNPKNCPICGSVYIKYFGVGTQRIEEYLAEEFPTARVLRMDMDTTSRKNSHQTIINQFADGGAQILVGTQMIAKGLNFPQVALVGIVAADMALNDANFRSAETAYQLMTQVAGRAGRGAEAGRVIIQTYNPDHYSIKYAMADDFTAFYHHEIAMRRQMNYPPFSHLFQIMFVGEKEQRLVELLHGLARIMKAANRKGLCEILGPAPCVISKMNSNYRWKLLVKCGDEEILKQFVHYCLEKLEKTHNMDGVRANLTPNPAYIQ
ncbi:MAG: primosomal protein N' [Defluviitaleaceae bacterium]|nr:primosomal protein N' [Defluviitaleaceae bacterium]